jgi:hypothetical protein
MCHLGGAGFVASHAHDYAAACPLRWWATDARTGLRSEPIGAGTHRFYVIAPPMFPIPHQPALPHMAMPEVVAIPAGEGCCAEADDPSAASATGQDILERAQCLAGVFQQDLQLQGMVGPERATVPISNDHGVERRPIKGADDGSQQIPGIPLGDDVREIVFHGQHQLAHDIEHASGLGEVVVDVPP